MRLGIYTLTGQRVRLLVDGSLDAGWHEARWDGRDEAGRALGSGVYLCRLTVGGAVLCGKLTLVR